MHGHIGHGQDAIAAKLVNKKLVCYAGQQDDVNVIIVMMMMI